MKNNFTGFNFTRKRIKGLRVNIYLILWLLITIGSVFLLVRFAAISFSKEINQDKLSFKESMLFYCSNKIMDSGSALVRYTEGVKPQRGLSGNLFAKQFALKDYLTDKSELSVKAKENALQINGTSIDMKDLQDRIEASEQKINKENSKNNENNELQSEGTFPPEEKDDSMNNSEEDRYHIQIDSALKYDQIAGNLISLEYMLTNGAFYSDKQAAFYVANSEQENNYLLDIGFVYGNMELQETEDNSAKASQAMAASNPGNLIDFTMEQLKDTNFLVRNFYIVDPATKVTESLFNAEKLLSKDMKLKQGNDAPQILIYHTHSQETYIDSRENEKADTVVGVGSFLTQILEDRYGYQVIHDTACYDIIDGVLNRNKAYNMAEEGISKILEENPTIEVVIDLHRDGASDKRTTIINGEETAQVMMFNGLSRDPKGPITYLENPYLEDNLAMSLQLQLKGIDLYPGLFYKNYLHCYRYNLHVRPKSLLIELGTDKNTLQSAKNAMEPFAEVLNAVLQGK